MREMDCPCGLTLTGADGDALFRRDRVHAGEHHANDSVPRDFIREQVAANARNASSA